MEKSSRKTKTSQSDKRNRKSKSKISEEINNQKLTTKKYPNSDAFITEFYQAFKE